MIMYQKEKLDLRTFGRTVQEAREGKGLKREKLAEMLDLSPRHTQYIETRGQHPSLQKFYEIVTLFDISVDNIFFPDTTKSKTTQRRQLDTLLDGMDEKDLSVITATADAMIKVKEAGE
jgi:transcriptional regulator with XRE-family HTH domain